MVDFALSAIPTYYKGRRYRSRLEARWAAFFDLVEWPAEYEPFDLNGYIPDFCLRGAVPTIVEVKPVHGLDDPRLDAVISKIKHSNWRGDAIIVSHFLPDEEGLGPGWMGQLDEGSWLWDQALFTSFDTKFGFCPLQGLAVDNITGDEGFELSWIIDPDRELIIRRWTKAGNLVQWQR